MPVFRFERISGVYQFLSTDTTVILRNLVNPARTGETPNDIIVLDVTCFVVTASNGTGTVSFGKTGTVNAYMLTTDVGAGVTGRKVTPTGASLAGLGDRITPGAALVNFTGTYTVGTDTISPLIRFCIWLGHYPDLDKLRVQRS